MNKDNQPETSGKVWPCAHIFFKKEWNGWALKALVYEGEIVSATSWKLCPMCGSQRPEESKDELDEIFEKYKGCCVNEHIPSELLKDLRVWKEKDCGVVIKEVEEEKPKRLAYLFLENYWSTKQPPLLPACQNLATVALDWMLGILPTEKFNAAECFIEWNLCLAEIRQRIERERNA